MAKMDLATCLTQTRAHINTHLNTLLPPEHGLQKTLYAAMRYAMLGKKGGKVLRPFLLLQAAQIVGAQNTKPAYITHVEDKNTALFANTGYIRAACALECVHVYSLIHDDLPCMDDGQTRRGQPCTHKVYGEGMALLAGNALLSLAFEWLAHCDTHADAQIRAQLIHNMAICVGGAGMMGGQAIDIETQLSMPDLAKDRVSNLERAQSLQVLKTGALIGVSLSSGACLAGASACDYDNLARYGAHIGLAYQIRDDVLDVSGDAAVMGKGTGADVGNDKYSFVSLYGEAEAMRRAQDLITQAKHALTAYGERAIYLRALADYILTRQS